MVAEVVHGTPYRFQDPARFSLAHGGKDRHPYPVPIKVYDETIRVLKSAVQKAKLGQTEEMQALRRLDDQARRLERTATRPVARGLHRRRAQPFAIARWPVGVRVGEGSARTSRARLTAQPDEDRHLQHQQRQPPPAQSAGLAERARSRTSSACRSSNAPTHSFPRRRSSRPAITPCGAGRGPGTASPSSRGVRSRS